MLRRDRQIRLGVHQWVDGVLCAFGLGLAYLERSLWATLSIRRWITEHIGETYSWERSLLASLSNRGRHQPIAEFYPFYFWLFLAVIPLSMFVLQSSGYYKRPVFSPRHQMFWQLARPWFFCSTALILVTYLLRSEPAARGVIILFGLNSFLLVYLKEELVRWSYASKLGSHQFKKRIVLAGDSEQTRAWRSTVAKEQDFEVLAELDLNQISIEELVSFLHEHSVNGVILSAGKTSFGRVEQALLACELEGIEAWLVADFFKTQISHIGVDELHGRPMLVFQCGPQMPWASLVKQIIDFCGAVVLLVLFSPILVAAAIAIKLSSKGPILFRQERSGLNGKPFRMYKFRSMVTDAEQLRHELAALNEMSGPVFKIADDPRITPVGRFLRRRSIDEFPQLFNVLRGEMSLVGPRPLPVHEVQRFDDVAHRRRLSVKPGLTCLWQVGGRNEVRDFRDWVRLDLEYIDHWSLWLDFKILWRTVPVVLLGKGAR